MSSEVKRYDSVGYDGLSAMMEEHPEGDYVRAEDYDALRAQLAAIQGGMGEVVEVVGYGCFWSEHGVPCARLLTDKEDAHDNALRIKRAILASEDMRVEPLMTVAQHQRITAAMAAEVERLKGLTPELPPRPPEGEGLPRYGLRWNGPQQPLAVPMDDGYWTPWHLADALRAELAEVKGRYK